MQEMALSHRVARSAKDLACATLSGTFELNDVRSSKQAGTSTQTSYHGENHSSSSSSSVRSRPDLRTRENSFRNKLNATACKEAREDFDQFQALDDFQKQQHLEFAACLESRQGPDSFKDVLQAPHSHALDGIHEKHISSVTDLDELTSRPGLISGSVCEENADSAHAAALRRLHLIGAHLQRNLATEVLQQDAYEQAHVSMHQALSHVEIEHIQQHFDEQRNPIRSDASKSDLDIDQQRASPQHDESIMRDQRPSAASPEKEENMLQRQFHCPYYACHRNLQHLSTSDSSSSQKRCVHVGCEFQAERFDVWAEHIHVPHHDLLGSS